MANGKLPNALKRGLFSTSQSTKRLITDFADASGMVYFGYVSQRGDEHHIVRGLTVSTKHHDDHYCIGTYENYDVVFVERSDTLQSGKRHVWHIMEFDLQTAVDVPHIFLGSTNRGYGFHELLELKYPSLQSIELGVSAMYPDAFKKQLSVYATPAHAVSVEHLITPDVASTIAAHFSGLVIEVTERALYLYSEKAHLSSELLDTMLKNGAWLAAKLDENSRQL
ncbi:MAG: hypothetical protein V4678_04665 [Patescibacteria group bacterium]